MNTTTAPVHPTAAPRPVLVLTTGGTIDKEYGRDGELHIGRPMAPLLLRTAGVDDVFTVEPILAKDSLDFTDEDRATIVERVRLVSGGGVVITHGTDTMTVTAEHLATSGAVREGVTVVFTGAMRPARMRDSDAAFNLGAAVTAAQLLDPGVHVAMGGRVFLAGHVVKDRAAGHFVPIP